MNFISQLLETFFKMVYSSFKDNTKGADLADMQLASKYNKGIRFLLCAIDIFSKYVWIVPLKDKNGVIIVNAIQCILDSSKTKPNKLWVDQDSESYNSTFKKWLENDDIKMYSAYNEEKSIVAEKFIRTLKNEIFNSCVKKCLVWWFRWYCS